MDVTRRVCRRLEQLTAEDALRRCPPIRERDGVHYVLDDRRVVGFCSNDYLGLASRLGTAEPTPLGAGASRLISGDSEGHRALEARLAELVGFPDAVLFPSGFQLNVGVLPCLLELHDHVDSDALNHASLIDGIRLARATTRVLPHATAPTPVRVPDDAAHWWVTESVFSMDGDRVDPTAVATHLAAGGALYVDEAHALGLFPGGRGYLATVGLAPTVLVGTLSKALGAAGAFVAASSPICELIRNRARSFVFSTGVSPVLVPRLHQAVDLVASSEGDELRDRLWANTAAFARALDLPAPPSPIFPLLLGDNATALQLGAELLDRGWHVQAIRPPTVPPGTARLRVTISAAHSVDQVKALAADLREAFERRALPLRAERGRAEPLATAAR